MAYNNPVASVPPRGRAESSLMVKALQDLRLGAQHVQRMLKIGRIGTGDLDSSAIGGVSKRQRARVQPLPFQAQAFGQARMAPYVGSTTQGWCSARRDTNWSVGAAALRDDSERLAARNISRVSEW